MLGIYLLIEKFRKENNYEERLAAVKELANIGEPTAAPHSLPTVTPQAL